MHTVAGEVLARHAWMTALAIPIIVLLNRTAFRKLQVV